MKGLKGFVGLMVLIFVFVVFSGTSMSAADKKETKAKEVPAKDAGKSKKKDKKAEAPSAGEDGVFYKHDFEEEDDIDAIEGSDGSEAEWIKKGANGSKGALKTYPSDKTVKNFGVEKYVAWLDNNTWIEFDCLAHGLTSKASVVSHGEKMGKNGSALTKLLEPDKWTHVKVKAKSIASMEGKTGKGDSFKNLVFYFSVKDPEIEGGPFALIDNIQIKSYPEGTGPIEPVATPAPVEAPAAK